MKRLATSALMVLSVAVAAVFAQSGGTSGTVHGVVLDPSGASIAGAAVTIQNPVSHFTRSALTGSEGKFQFDNIPYNNYHASITAAGFDPATQDVDVRSPVALDLKITLTVGEAKQSVTVEAAADLIESTPTAHTDVDR